MFKCLHSIGISVVISPLQNVSSNTQMWNSDYNNQKNKEMYPQDFII